MPKFLYTVITRENAAACDASPAIWEAHPDWTMFVRSNYKHPNTNCWVGCGGTDLKRCLDHICVALYKMSNQDQQIKVVGGVVLVGLPTAEQSGWEAEESPTIIKL